MNSATSSGGQSVVVLQRYSALRGAIDVLLKMMLLLISQMPFKGAFDGNGYRLSSVVILRDRENYLAPFGYIQVVSCLLKVWDIIDGRHPTTRTKQLHFDII